LDGQAPGVIAVNGNLLGSGQNADQFAPGAQVLFAGAGTPAAPQLLEAMGQDVGNAAAGFNKNFVYYNLALANNTYVKLVDQSDNVAGSGAEAVYANNLIVPAGSTLDLGGLHLYARFSQVAGTVTGGPVTLVADGGPLVRDLPSLGSISAAAQVDDWTF